MLGCGYITYIPAPDIPQTKMKSKQLYLPRTSITVEPKFDYLRLEEIFDIPCGGSKVWNFICCGTDASKADVMKKIVDAVIERTTFTTDITVHQI